MRILFRIFNESVAIAIRELRVNKLRTILTLLGISIGIFCVISIFSSVDSLENNLRTSINKFGSNVIYITKFPWAPEEGETEYPWWKYWNRPYAKFDEMRSLQEKLTGSDAVAVSIWIGAPVIKYGARNISNSTINGVSQDYNRIMNLNLQSGRYFTPAEANAGQPKAIIGYEVATQLFPGNVDPVGREIDIYGQKVMVIGVFSKEGKTLIQNSNDNLVMVPYQFLVSKVKVDGFQVEPAILVKAKDGVSLDELKDEIRGLMRADRRVRPNQEDNFALNQISIISNQLSQLFGVLDVVALIIGGFAILVGGFGIANIMFVSVRERTNLIGIKKALGAKNYFILLEFLIEAIILSVIGGIFGLILVYFTVEGLSAAINFKLTLDLKNIIWGIGTSAVIGFIAGIIPAIVAARMRPVDAIRFK
ncbi:MAG: ABC transporter permease [Chitinophagaceae bacterium]|nr:ABC transporter permease [Chitinophagaceae bacterium]